MKTHLYGRVDREGNFPHHMACGAVFFSTPRGDSEPGFTTRSRDVTCGLCRRTVLWKKRAALEEQHGTNA